MPHWLSTIPYPTCTREIIVNLPLATDYDSEVDEKEMGAPDKYPEHTFEVHHSRRRSYLITAENEEDKNAWVETFKVCCRKASGKSV